MMAGLDWHDHRIGPLRPRRWCRRPALMRDDDGQPCHKTCAEARTATTSNSDLDALALDIDAYADAA